MYLSLPNPSTLPLTFLSPETRRTVARVLPFVLIWLLFSSVYVMIEGSLIGTLDYYPGTGNPYSLRSSITVIPPVAAVVGLLFGLLEISYVNRLFTGKRFIVKLLCKVLLYLFLITVFLMILSLIGNAVVLRASIFDARVWELFWIFVTDFSFFSVTVYIASILTVSLFYHEVNENLGYGVVANFFTGKYHTPREEERIFMFVDMKSSTTIAEKLGHVRYFEMLREYYNDLSSPIIRHHGELYQYVGDEVVISWTLRSGITNNNCIACFFALKASLRNHADKYLQRFGHVPQFKAALHVGPVTTGEIGALKKEIIFTGDVLNTTARIQSLCNEYNTDLLISETLLQKLSLAPSLTPIALGETELRGRDEKVTLFTLAAVV